MASPSGTEDSDVAVLEPPTPRYARGEHLLQRTPQEFELFQCVRLLERIFPSRAPIGRFVSPSREVVRFGAHASFPFPASQIQRIDWSADQSRAPRMVINFMG